MTTQSAHSNREEILNAFQDTNGWVTPPKVAAKAGVSQSSARRHLKDFAEEEIAEDRRNLYDLRVTEYRYIGLPEWWDA